MTVQTILSNLPKGAVVMNVWSNGKAIRKYTGQDNMYVTRHTTEKGFRKYKAILIPVEIEGE